MKTYWKIMCSLAGVTALAGGSLGQQAQPSSAQSQVSEKPTKFSTVYDVGADLPGVLNGRPDRQLPDAGAGAAGCQLLYGTNHNNATSFECMDDFHPINSGNITRVTWAGVYRKGTSVATFANAAPPGLEPTTSGPEQFEITIYEMDTAGGVFDVGLPLNAATDIFPSRVSRQLINSPTRTVDPQTVTVGTVTFTIYNYDATLPTPVAVVNTKCYLLQIRAVCNANFDGSFNNGSSTVPGWSFRWMRAAAGNGRALQVASTNNVPATAACGSPTANPQTVTAADAAAADFAFCLNIAFDRNAPCKQTGTCQQVSANCQNYANGTENRFSFNGGANSADNFTITAATNLSGVCWTGFYSGQVLADNDFIINIYNNNTSPCGSLGTFSYPTTLVATRTVGPATSGNDGQTRRNPARFNGPPITYTNFLEWNVSFTSPILLQPGCYWIEIVSQGSTAWTWLSNWGDPNSNVRNGGDQYFHQHPNAGTYGIGTRVSGFDLAFCLNFALNPLASCSPGPSPANSACLTAQALTVGGAPAVGFTTVTGGGVDSGGGQLPPAFGTVIDNGGTGGIWYTLVGNGQNITVSTCNTGTAPCAGTPTGTDHDTILAVYCAASCAGPFKSVAYNDDQGGTACTVLATASTVTFPSVSGQTYYVYAMRAGFSGFFYINATSAALGTLTPVPCASIVEPPAPIATFPAGSVNETEACGAGSAATAPGETCQTAYAATVGTRRCGTVDSSPSTFDDDWYKFTDVATATAYNVELLCESPTNIFVFGAGPATCPTTGAPATQLAGFTIFPNNVPGNFQFQVNVPVGQFYILIQPTQTDGMACSTNRNKYCLFVTAAPIGACCVGVGSGCVQTTLEDCADGTGWMGADSVCSAALCDPNTGNPAVPVGACCFFDGGCAIASQAGCTGANGDSRNVYSGNATVCTTTNICPATTACCFANGSCTFLIASACTGSGGTSVAGRGCLPNSCPPPAPTGVCCVNGACSITTQAACSGTWSAGGSCSPNPCPPPTGSCCATDGGCTVTTQAACSGTWTSGANCTPNNCPQPSTGRCCVGSRCVTGIDAAACTALAVAPAGRVFTVGATNCNALGVFNTPCCFADYNKVGGIGVQDIFDFLAGWFANSPNANVQGNGTAPGVQDIFDFLSAWFGGGC